MKKYVINEAFISSLDNLDTLLKNNIAGMFGGNKQSKNLTSFGSSPDFADHRDYIPGDDVNKIDWNAYARFDKLYLKLYSDERQLHTRIYIDASRSMDYGKGQKAEQAVALAAAFAYIAVSEMDRVSVYAIKGRECIEMIQPIMGKDSFYGEIGKLNDIEFDGDSCISEAIMSSSVGHGDGLSLIISDFLTENDYEGAIDRIVSSRRDLLCIQVLSREELSPSFSGKVHLFDSEDLRMSYKKNIDRDIVRAYRAALEYATGRIRDLCLSRGGEYLLAAADESVTDIIFGRLTDMGVIK